MTRLCWADGATAVIGIGTAFRFWHLASSGSQYDEIIYTDVARSVATGHGLVEKYSVGLPYQPSDSSASVGVFAVWVRR